jgi:hypothetical protein
MGSAVHSFTGSRVQGFKGSKVQGFKGSRFKGSRVQGWKVHRFGLCRFWRLDYTKSVDPVEPGTEPELLNLLNP